jgi:branched-chain amino acid transport system permease protein
MIMRRVQPVAVQGRVWWIVGAAVTLVLAPFLVTNAYVRHLLVISMLYAVVAACWDLSLGYGGVFNFAHVALFAIGAYTGGILTKTCGFPPLLAILLGGGAAVIASIVVCLPALRVKGIYVCLVTFAFGQLCLHIVRSQGDITGGNRGLVLIPPIRIGGYVFTANDKIAYYYLALILLFGATIFLRALVNSYFGLSIIALRDYEEYAISRGVPLTRQRLLTFAASAVFTGITGAVYALYLGVVSADLFGFGYTITLLSMVVVGGTATTYGPILGAFILGFATEFMTDLGPWRHIITAVLIILVLRFYPEGLYGGLRRLAEVATRKGKA